MNVSRKQKLCNDITRTCENMKRKVLENKGLNVNERLRVVANIDVFCIRIKEEILKPVKSIEGTVLINEDY